MQGLGISRVNMAWVAFKDINYKKKYVFFDRFQFDVCSLASSLIEDGEMDTELFEVLLRQVYTAITFHQNDRVMVRQLQDVIMQNERALQESAELDHDAGTDLADSLLGENQSPLSIN